MAVAKPRSRQSNSKGKRDSNVTLPYITGDILPGASLKMSDVDKLHAAGIKGAGIKIAVVDTGR